MSNVLIRKLEAYAPLSEADRLLLVSATAGAREVPARHELAGEGERPAGPQLLLEGFACECKYLPNGERQIVAIVLPGDLCDYHQSVLRHVDHTVMTLSRSRVAEISPALMAEIRARPALARALDWAALTAQATLREWVVNVGRRSSEVRTAHLICEIYVRLRAVGLAQDAAFALPMTQQELADTVGISAVHTNRVLQSLRQRGLILLDDKQVTILAPNRLAAIGQFHAQYLHLGHPLVGNFEAGPAMAATAS